jgi:alkanesulfonate monooxygenase
MEIGINIRHQMGASYEELRAGVLEAERLGFGSVFFPDHYMPTETSGTDEHGRRTAPVRSSPTGPSDAWTLIALLVPQTSHIRFGTMMTSSTFRYPGPLAVSVSQINAVSGGRIDLGIGTNWFEPEHLAYGVPYPPQAERFARLEEQLAIISGLWNTPVDPLYQFDGTYFRVVDGRPVPPPASGAPKARIVIGGSGLKRTPRVAATYAGEANASGAPTPERAQPFFDACAVACDKRGRDPKTLRRSVMLRVCCGEDDADIVRQASDAGLTVEAIRASGVLVCRPTELVERLDEWEASGVDRVVISRRSAVDLPSLRLIGEAVLPLVANASGRPHG